MKIKFLIIFILLLVTSSLNNLQLKASEMGSELWFTNNELFEANETIIPGGITIVDESGELSIAQMELISGLNSLYSMKLNVHETPQTGDLVIAAGEVARLKGWISRPELDNLGNEGFQIKQLADVDFTLLTGKTPQAVLYGVFYYLRWLQTQSAMAGYINIQQKPAYEKRVLNHWDNLDGTVERGYAGSSIWKWDELPQKVSYRYREYARANASVGINGTVLNNVNANPQILNANYLEKVKVIANELRPYGMQVYLSVNFASPIILGGLENANPANPAVIEWWHSKVAEIYAQIPDFGGFLVKANSEGQPGPHDYGMTHADGANMLAKALIPYGGIVMWRAFIYQPDSDDRAKEAYNTFMPLDGKFNENVILQVKNGPIDFQPREPFNPLFGGMNNTSLMPELQITQEYLGFSTHLVYLGTLYSEFLQSDTYANGVGSTVAHITREQKRPHNFNGIAGVANIGDDNNWCGYSFAQANWYVFGRMAWNPDLSPEKIAEEWVRQTFTQQTPVVDTIVSLMMTSREIAVNYMTPLGLHHLMGWGHHYGPEPWCYVEGARPDWMPSYYHRADSMGIGFNRSASGSKAVEQYYDPLRSIFNDPAKCSEKYLLWFHYLPWDFVLNSGNTLWEELCFTYNKGVNDVRKMQTSWYKLEPEIDLYRYIEVKEKLQKQLEEAIWWKDACLLYFQTFSNKPFPASIEQPVYTLEELKERSKSLRNFDTSQ